VRRRALRIGRVVPAALLSLAVACSGPGGDDPPAGAAGADDSGPWAEVERLYEQAREAGETVSADAYEWLKEDLDHIGDWEYRLIVADPVEIELERTMNKLGVERWECFAVVPEGSSLRLFFKRPVKSYLKHIPISDLWKLVPGKGEGDAVE
jgi:hypothetical protein